MHERISMNPKVCGGKACVKGTRIPVALVLGVLASGESEASLLENYPSLTHDDVLACLRYGAVLAEEEMSPFEEVTPLEMETAGT